MNKRIRRNSKVFASTIANAKNVLCFSLSNGFCGREITHPISDDDKANGELWRVADTYRLRVHSNLWYEWVA